MKNPDITRLARWLRRARPPRRDLWRALVAGFVASTLNVTLVVGAVALLVESATRPGLRAVAVALILLELFAFLRSPLRFYERLSAHQLGYAAVTHWRRWLVGAVGRLNFSQWRDYATGDLLERALGDTDELQDLWLRFALPLLSTVGTLLLGDIIVGFLPPYGRWWAFTFTLVLAQSLALGSLGLSTRRELARDRALRAARGHYRAQLVELAALAPELVLLHRENFVQERNDTVVQKLEGAEDALRRQRRLTHGVIILLSLMAVTGVAFSPVTSSVWVAVAALIGLSTYEGLTALRSALHAAVEVSGGGERLEEFDVPTHQRSRSWPHDSTLRLHDVTVAEGHRVLVKNASLVVAPGSHLAIVGESGAGKSTLLRALASLDDLVDGVITVGDVLLSEILEDELRHHLAFVMSEPGFTRGFAIDVVALGRSTSRNPHADLGALGITSDVTTHFDQLSRGERARVAVARALVSSPHIYLLDEPTAGLGRDETKRVLSLLEATKSTVIIATHDNDVIAWSDQVVIVRNEQLELVTR